MYNNSVGHASNGTLSRLPSLCRLFSPLFTRRSQGPPSPKSAGSPRVRAGDTSPIRARPLLILVLDGERSSILFATVARTLLSLLVHLVPSRCFRARARNSCGDEGGGGGQRDR